MEKISPRFYCAVSFMVGCIDWLIFSYWLKKYLRCPVKESSRWERMRRKIAGSFITWGMRGGSIPHTIIWLMLLILCHTLHISGGGKFLSDLGIDLDGISMSELGEWK